MASSPDALPLERSYGSSLPRGFRDVFRLPAVSTSVAEARRRVLGRLREWNVDAPLCDNAQLVVSELVTNAVRHTDSEKVCCALHLAGVRLRVEVTDQGHGSCAPYSRPVDAEEESGRGLLLVSVVSADWGIRPNHDGVGHCVWAELDADLDAARRPGPGGPS